MFAKPGYTDEGPGLSRSGLWTLHQNSGQYSGNRTCLSAGPGLAAACQAVLAPSLCRLPARPPVRLHLDPLITLQQHPCLDGARRASHYGAWV